MWPALAWIWHRSGVDLAQIWSGLGTDLAWIWHRSGVDLAKMWIWHRACTESRRALLTPRQTFLFLSQALAASTAFPGSQHWSSAHNTTAECTHLSDTKERKKKHHIHQSTNNQLHLAPRPHDRGRHKTHWVRRTCGKHLGALKNCYNTGGERKLASPMHCRGAEGHQSEKCNGSGFRETLTVGHMEGSWDRRR